MVDINEFWEKHCVAVTIVAVIIVIVYFMQVENMVVRHVFTSGASQRFAGEQTASNQGPPSNVRLGNIEAQHLEDLREESRKIMGNEEFSNNVVTMEPSPGYASLDEAIENAVKNNLLLDPQGHNAYEILLQNQLYR